MKTPNWTPVQCPTGIAYVAQASNTVAVVVRPSFRSPSRWTVHVEGCGDIKGLSKKQAFRIAEELLKR